MDDDDDRFLPETDQAGTGDDGAMHVSPALRALMAKCGFVPWDYYAK